jgi:hypothetical protein
MRALLLCYDGRTVVTFTMLLLLLVPLHDMRQ